MLHVVAPSLQDRVCEMHQLQAHLHQHPEMRPKTIGDVLLQAEMLGLLRVLKKKIKKNVKVVQRMMQPACIAIAHLIEQAACPPLSLQLVR
jgi:hypothetical protein